LPEQWYCYMNPNTQRNTCEKPEERMCKGEVWGAEEEEPEDEDDEQMAEDILNNGTDEVIRPCSERQDGPHTVAAKVKVAQEEAQRVALMQIERERREAEHADLALATDDGTFSYSSRPSCGMKQSGNEDHTLVAAIASAGRVEGGPVHVGASAIVSKQGAEEQDTDGHAMKEEAYAFIAASDASHEHDDSPPHTLAIGSEPTAGTARFDANAAVVAGLLAAGGKGKCTEAATEAEASVSSTSGWAAMLLKKKQEQERKQFEAEAEQSRKAKEDAAGATKSDPKQLAIERKPIGHMRLRGILVPGGFEGDLTAWRYVTTAPVVGWAVQHSGQLRMRSLWLRTANAWYWLRSSPPSFFPASVGRVLWEPPGATSSAPIAESLLLGSPMLAAYRAVRSPPPRAIGLAALVEAGIADKSVDLAEGTASVALAAFRISAFFFVDEAGNPADLFKAIPLGLLSLAGTTPTSISSSPVKQDCTASTRVHLVGQLLPSQRTPTEGEVGLGNSTRIGCGGASGDSASAIFPCGNGASGHGANDSGGMGGRQGSNSVATVDEVPARFWLRSMAIEEWRLQLDSATPPGNRSSSSGCDVAGRHGNLTIWVRSASSWFQLLKPRIGASWKPPGTKERPLDDALLPAAVSKSESSPLPSAAALPHRILYRFVVMREADGEAVPISEALSNIGRPDATTLCVLGTSGPPPTAAGADTSSTAPLNVSNANAMWVRSAPLVAGCLDYSVTPPALWLQTPCALYRLVQPADEYATHYRPPGGNRNQPLAESALVGAMLPVYRRSEDHPFESAKGNVVPALHLTEFELSDASGTPRSLIATLPEGTLRAAQKAQKAAAVPSVTSDALEVYIKARAMPVTEGGSRPWVWAGPIRAWSADLEHRGGDGKLYPGLWLCTKTIAYFAPLVKAATTNDAHARSWFACDGLLTRYAAELLAGCREHRDPRTAVKLFNTISSTAWSRLPADVTSKLGIKKEATLAERHFTSFVVEALEDGGYTDFAKRVAEQRIEFERRQERLAARPGGPSHVAVALPRRHIAPPPAADESCRSGPATSSRTTPGAAFGIGSKRPADGAIQALGTAKEGKLPKVGGRGKIGTEVVRPPPATARATAGGGGAFVSGVGSGGAASAAACGKGIGPKDPDDAEVARTMLAVLRKAHAPLSLAQVALACKDALPLSMWNLARWLQAVGRALKARPRWFASIGTDMLGIGLEPGVEPHTHPRTDPAVVASASSTPCGIPVVADAVLGDSGTGTGTGTGGLGFGGSLGPGTGPSMQRTGVGGPGVARGGPGLV